MKKKTTTQQARLVRSVASTLLLTIGTMVFSETVKAVENCHPPGGGSSSDASHTPTGGNSPASPNKFPYPFTEAQFNQMFPKRNPAYTYAGLMTAYVAFKDFASAGDDTTNKQEFAAFLAHVAQETNGLALLEEPNKGDNCKPSAKYPCAPGKQYYGRGPLQITGNENYGVIGEALQLPLLQYPEVMKDQVTGWLTAIWFWMNQKGGGKTTPHDAMVNHSGFGETVRSINGTAECDGRKQQEVQSRGKYYQAITKILGVPAGDNLECGNSSAGQPQPGNQAGGGGSGNDLQFCVDENNRYRVTKGRSALQRSGSLEQYAGESARYSQEKKRAHAYVADHGFPQNHGAVGENMLPGWMGWSMNGKTMRQILSEGIKMMWDEGPGGGHYENMVSSNFNYVGCGIYVDPGTQQVTVSIDFGSK
ncbi:MAG: glycoside hydrolase family 19 protein [Pseudomonadota bacterium]